MDCKIILDEMYIFLEKKFLINAEKPDQVNL
jgi:hypothetical protein